MRRCASEGGSGSRPRKTTLRNRSQRSATRAKESNGACRNNREGHSGSRPKRATYSQTIEERRCPNRELENKRRAELLLWWTGRQPEGATVRSKQELHLVRRWIL